MRVFICGTLLAPTLSSGALAVSYSIKSLYSAPTVFRDSGDSLGNSTGVGGVIGACGASSGVSRNASVPTLPKVL